MTLSMTLSARQKTARIHEKFAHLVKMSSELEKRPRSYGTGELLSGSEIHLIEMIGDNEERLSVTDLARHMNVTKGAVSQNLKRLEHKGLTTKQDDPANGARSIVLLTSKGKVAFYAHRHWHETMDGGYREYFMNLDSDRLDFVLEFLERVEDFLARVLKS
jgi:DNA-binding MarR family transcriptional regulator